MGQQTLIYRFVARGTVILAEYHRLHRKFYEHRGSMPPETAC
ncbi:unnamed protein product [Rhodiola kirilowii]